MLGKNEDPNLSLQYWSEKLSMAACVPVILALVGTEMKKITVARISPT